MFPFTKNPLDSVSALGEIRLIERIREKLGNASPPSPRGMGDDCAVLPNAPAGTSRLVTTDSVIFGKHFDKTVPARDVGKKLVRRNVSDIAAMGGVPADAVLALVMSGNVAQIWIDDFFSGVAEACAECGLELSGGDIAGAPTTLFSATLALTGFSENPILRSGAREGDLLFVTGTLGGSLLKKHFAFTPRIAEGRFLCALPSGKIRACIDVTDGLLKDHAALLPAETHAEFDFEALPVSADARALGGDLVKRVFCDGEDYELLFAVEPEFENELRKRWSEAFTETPLTRIAKISAGTQNPSLKKKLPTHAHAFDHFHE